MVNPALMNHFLVVILIASVVALLGPILVIGGVKDKVKLLVPVANDPLRAQVLMWLFLLSLQGVTWVFSAFFLISIWQGLSAINTQWGWSFVADVILPPAFISLPVVVLSFVSRRRLKPAQPDAPRIESIPPEELYELPIGNLPSFGRLGVAVAIFAFTTMYYVQHVLKGACSLQGYGCSDLSLLMRLYDQLDDCLLVAGVILGLGTLATAALRNAVNAEHKSDFIPAGAVILFGAIYSMFSIIAYVPVRLSFWEASTRTLHQLMGSPPLSAQGLKDWYELRGKLQDPLRLNLISLASITGPISAIIPLLTGWIATFLKDAGAKKDG